MGTKKKKNKDLKWWESEICFLTVEQSEKLETQVPFQHEIGAFGLSEQGQSEMDETQSPE